jgi:NADH-quinone oxidoreductase subunit M
MLTIFLIIFPLIAAGFALLAKGESVKRIAFLFALVEFAAALYALFQFTPGPVPQFIANYPWIPSLGISFHVSMDGISALLVLLTTLLVPFIILSTFGHSYKNPSAFYGLILIMQSALVGVFTARDGFLFYLFWEAALIPVYFLAGIWGGERRIQITFKFFVYTIFGSLFMLLGLAYLYYQAGTADLDAIYALNLPASTQSWLFWALFIAFAIKMPIFPFHTWQPDTYSESPTPATMLLSGIMLKMGIYGVIRWLLPVVPLGVEQWGTTAIILSVIGIVYGSVIAIRQRNVKRVLAYSSFAHVGLMSAGVFTLSQEGLQGAMVQMLAHGVNIVGLFFIMEIIYRRVQTRELDQLGGITQNTPNLTVYFMILLLGSVALPLTSGFVGEFLLLAGVFKFNPWYAAIAGLTIILSAVYMLRLFQGVMFGQPNEETALFSDLTVAEKATLIPLVAMVFWIGMYPAPFLKLTEPSVIELLKLVAR